MTQFDLPCPSKVEQTKKALHRDLSQSRATLVTIRKRM